ncbi:MAG: class I SAM-dependent methyltransferase, partial [Verrucomicrobia bacterium]
MPRFLGNHTLPSAAKRLASLVRGVGPVQTCSTIWSVIDDKYLRTFDRRYRVKTSDFILLSDTNFDPARLRDATQYGPVNGWAFRKLLKHLGLPRRWHFADLGCGLGRACVLAAEYGFEKVTGVELSPQFCAIARENIANCRPLAGKTASIEILQLDALDFCDQTDADVFFMFRPFSGEFLQRILQKLV